MNNIILRNSICLIGDSVFDNTPYVPEANDTLSQLTRMMPTTPIAMPAQDGAVIGDATEQVEKLGRLDPGRHLYVSAGGNDLLPHLSLLEEAGPTTNLAAYMRLATIRERFATQYTMLASRLKHYERVTLLTIYVPTDLPEPAKGPARVVIGMANDVITTIARRYCFDVIDTRSIFTHPKHFTEVIEPSDHGTTELCLAISKHFRRKVAA